MTQVHTITKMFLRVDVNRRPEEEARQSFTERERENFFILLRRAEKGKRKTKESARVRFLFFLEREREERDSFVVVVSLTSFTSSSPGHHQ